VLKTPATVREMAVPAEYAEIPRQVMDRQVSSREIGIPATYQTVTRQEIDVDKLKAMGYRFDDTGDIVATPTGDRVVRASAINGPAGNKSAGAKSGVEGYVREIKIPAEYRTISRHVIDTPAIVRTVEIPATYKTVKTRVVVTPARTEETVTPAVYKTVSREVVDTAATTREVAVPALYGTVSRQVVDTAATTRQIATAAVNETLTRRVVDTEATFREETVPAVYKTNSWQVVDKPASTRAIEVPAQYETLSYQFKVSEPKTDRRAILCEGNATPAKIAEIQRALQKAGHNPGPIDGVMRALTMDGVNSYQKAKGLPVDGYLNIETVKSLGVSPY
jgi:hypothetical protein